MYKHSKHTQEMASPPCGYVSAVDERDSCLGESDEYCNDGNDIGCSNGHTNTSETYKKQTLAQTKESRRRAELDARLLANRIALLKQEEEKAWKKIEETRERAVDIIRMRNRNHQKILEKEAQNQKKLEVVREAQEMNAKIRKKNIECREISKRGLVEHKRLEVKEQKIESKHYIEIKKERAIEESLDNSLRTDFVKAQRKTLAKKLEQEKKAKLEAFSRDYRNRVMEEELQKSRTEALVSTLEKQELELIQRLQNTQVIQNSALEELGNALEASLLKPNTHGITNLNGRGKLKHNESKRGISSNKRASNTYTANSPFAKCK